LPRSWIEELSLDQIDIPGGVRWSDPDDYDSDTSRRWVESWRHGLRAADARAAVELLGTAFTSYDLRHCWAVRSIRSGLPMTLCAKALGHSVQVHEQQYHRWLTADALRSAMAQLQL
jgi:integrase